MSEGGDLIESKHPTGAFESVKGAEKLMDGFAWWGVWPNLQNSFLNLLQKILRFEQERVTGVGGLHNY
jgi:hypothetical protein